MILLRQKLFSSPSTRRENKFMDLLRSATKNKNSDYLFVPKEEFKTAIALDHERRTALGRAIRRGEKLETKKLASMGPYEWERYKLYKTSKKLLKK